MKLHNHNDEYGHDYKSRHGHGKKYNSGKESECSRPCEDHRHSHTQTKVVLNRLSRAIGHLEAVKQMVEDNRDCSEVLIQLAAVRSALNNTGKLILKDHLDHCIVDAVSEKDPVAIENFKKAIDLFVK